MVQTLMLPVYKPSKQAAKVLQLGKILAKGETSQMMLERVVNTLMLPERKFGTDIGKINNVKIELAQYIASKMIIPGSPILTNAGRITQNALASCVVVPVDLRNKQEATKIIRDYFKQDMGTGFDFSNYEDPVGLLKWLNQLSETETATKSYNRNIANMGSLNIRHPRIREFIDAKRNNYLKYFNISVCIDDGFMEAALTNKTFQLSNGRYINAELLFNKIAENSHFNADPGLLFMERMNKDNPVESVYNYVCTPPCAEMGLSKGETCQFGYINVSKFIKKHNKAVTIDYNTLEKVVWLMTRILDNAIEYSLANYPHQSSVEVTRFKRKIGIGVCGLADLLMEMDLSYGSEEARILARDVLSFISYTSKVASVELAKERGACGAMNHRGQNKYYHEYLEQKYGMNPTNSVSTKDWYILGRQIKNTGYLRNILTTTLPPTGRTALLLDATSSIEPIFSIYDSSKNVLPIIEHYLKQKCSHLNIASIIEEAKNRGSFQCMSILPQHVRDCLKTAKELTPKEHLDMVKALAGLDGVVDEAASKTVNLAKDVTINEVKNIFIYAYKNGLKNISVYRDGSHHNQPRHL